MHADMQLFPIFILLLVYSNSTLDTLGVLTGACMETYLTSIGTVLEPIQI